MASVALRWATSEPKGSKVEKDLFRVEDTQAVDHVTLHASGGDVDLTYENGKWKVNHQWEADPSMIKVLFATLKQVEVRRPVSMAERDSVSSGLRRSGTEVTVWRGGQEVQRFFAGGERERNKSWFMKSEETQPYEMIIPGYRVYASGILELEEGGWRNKRIFDFNWRNFKTLKATYLKEPREGFEVELEGQYFGIKDMADVDTAKLNSYLDAVSLLFAERFVKQSKVTDSLSSREPAIRITIDDAGRHTYSLSLYPPRKNDPTVLGQLGTGEWVSLDRNSLAEIAWKRGYFRVRKEEVNGRN